MEVAQPEHFRRGRRLGDDARKILVNLSQYYPAITLASHSGVSLATLYRVLDSYRRNGDVHAHRLVGPGRRRLLGYEDTRFLVGSLQYRNDAYLDELRDQIRERRGRDVSLPTIYRALTRAGFSLKLISKRALERSELLRAQYLARIGTHYTTDQLVFVDESAADRRVFHRGQAWALEGSRACRKQFFVRKTRYSLLPAISIDGMVDCVVVQGAFNTRLFTEFISGLLDKMNRFPLPRSVIVMDNCAIHKAPEIRELIESRGAKLEYLPPYSPDFNPIELAFSVIKARLRRLGQNEQSGDWIVRQLYTQAYCITAHGKLLQPPGSDWKFYKKSLNKGGGKGINTI